MRYTLAAVLLTAAFSAQAAAKPKPVAKLNPIAAAHERVKDVLKDPDSARFRNDFAGKGGAVCGFVNAKNSYGGYDGFKRYIVTSEQIVIDTDESQAWKVDSRWQDFCAESEPVAKQ
jgi:hypothetical protein